MPEIVSEQDIQELIYKELRETPVGADWSEAHLRSFLMKVASKLEELK